MEKFGIDLTVLMINNRPTGLNFVNMTSEFFCMSFDGINILMLLILTSMRVSKTLEEIQYLFIIISGTLER